MAKKKDDSGIPANAKVVVLHGAERFQQDLLIADLRRALEKAHGEIEFIRFDGLTTALADVLDECRSFGLMQQQKLVYVDNADQLVKSDEDEAPKTRGKGAGVKRDNRRILETYAEHPSEQAVLVLRSDRWYPGNLDKAIAKVGAVIKCERMPVEQAVEWAVSNCKARHDAAIEPAAAALLVEYLGSDLGRIDTELAKLALSSPGKPITAMQVRQMTGVTREDDTWSIQSQLLTGNPADALSYLRDLIEVSREDPVPITYAYIDLARKIHGLSAGLKQGENPQALFRRFKLWGPSGEAVARVARKVHPATAARLLQSAVDADVRQKTGVGDPVRTLEQLTVRFARVVK